MGLEMTLCIFKMYNKVINIIKILTLLYNISNILFNFAPETNLITQNEQNYYFSTYQYCTAGH